MVSQTSGGASGDYRSRRDLRPVELLIDEVSGTRMNLNLNSIRENVMNYVPVWTVETNRSESNPAGCHYQRLSEVREKNTSVQEIECPTYYMALYFEGSSQNRRKILRRS